MSRVALILLLALAVLAVAWGFSHLAPPETDAPSAPRAPRRAPAARASGTAASSEAVSAHASPAAESPSASAETGYPAPPLRDLFSYADEPAASTAPAAGGAPAVGLDEPAAAPTPRPRPVRLVGFVRQAEQLRAALGVHGDVVLAAPGERVGDYLVLTLDEDTGVRMRGPDGAELTLRPER